MCFNFLALIKHSLIKYGHLICMMINRRIKTYEVILMILDNIVSSMFTKKKICTFI